MELLNSGGDISSPMQQHETIIVNDIFCTRGTLESLGDPHAYINRDGLDFLQIDEAYIAPWSFTGLPSSQTDQLMVSREKTQFLFFLSQETMGLYRTPLKTGKVMLYCPLFVIQGEIPLLSEAKFSNFLDFWKGTLVPVTNASIHFLAEGEMPLPASAPLVYINRQMLQGYFQV